MQKKSQRKNPALLPAVLMIPVIILLSAIFTTPALAEDCLHDPIYPVDWNAEVTTGARLRDIPCMETSVVITTLSVGEVVKVIAETDGYYQIRRSDGTEGWVGQWLITATDKPFSPSQPPAATTDPVTPVVPSEPLYDIVGHKYEPAIRWMDENGIISGYPDLSFKPDGTINRAEMVKIMSLTYDLLHPANDFLLVREEYNLPCFADIATDQWYTEYVCYAKEQGIIDGYPDGAFRPDREISRVEALKIILNATEFPLASLTSNDIFVDTFADEWYAPYLQTAYYNNLLEETAGANYYPSKSILRGETANLIYETHSLISF